MSFYQDIDTQIYVNDVLTNCTFSFHYQEEIKQTANDPGQAETFTITAALLEPVENLIVDLFSDAYFWLFEGDIESQLKDAAKEYLNDIGLPIKPVKSKVILENLLFRKQCGGIY